MRPTSSRAWRPKRSRARRRPGPSTCSSTTRRRTATSATRPALSRRRAITTPSSAPPYPHSRSQGFDEGSVNDKPSFIREAPYLSLDDIHTYRIYYQKALESLRSVDDGVKQIVDTLGAHAPSPQHLHHLHLRQRLLLRRAPPHRRQVPRLRALHPPALPDARARGSGRAAKPASWLPTSTSPRPSSNSPTRQRTRASTAARSSPSCTTPTCALGARSCSSPSSKPMTSKRTAAARPPHRRAWRPAESEAGRASTTQGAGHRLDRRSAEELLRDPPRPLQVHRVARRRERALRHQQGPLRAQQPDQGPQPVPDPQLPPRAARTARELCRQDVPGTGAEIPADSESAAAAETRKGTGTAGTPTQAPGAGWPVADLPAEWSAT